MRQYTEIYQDEFIDYAGKTHKFIIAAISDIIEDAELIQIDGLDTETVGSVTKGVKLGIAICNPTDKFSERSGVYRAIARAEDANYALLSPTRGYINTRVVQALLVQEAEYLKNNPEQYIPGYKDMRDRYIQNEAMRTMGDNFTEFERAIVEKVQEDPKFLSNIEEYINWKRNQKKGKCQKRGK